MAQILKRNGPAETESKLLHQFDFAAALTCTSFRIKLSALKHNLNVSIMHSCRDRVYLSQRLISNEMPGKAKDLEDI